MRILVWNSFSTIIVISGATNLKKLPVFLAAYQFELLKEALFSNVEKAATVI